MGPKRKRATGTRRSDEMQSQFFLPMMTYPDQTSEVVIGNAVKFANHCHALLHALAVEVTIPPITDPWASLLINVDTMALEAERASAKSGERLRSILRQHSTGTIVAPTCETVSIASVDVAETVAEIARNHDLTLLQSTPQFNALSQAVIFESGRPVVLFPDAPFLGRIDHVAIAWDRSRAAARAVADAMSLLGGATQLSVIYAIDEKPLTDDPGRRLFDSFAARGMRPEPYAIHTHGRVIGEALQEKAIELNADLLVMGGYGHSRMREFILGGATSDVLTNPLLPILMSH
jgi:nucleotide-binding universal stress UspA family protein